MMSFMYAGRGFRNFEIGDVDVVKHEGRYHLFHLVLPNHDFIAHAVSDDGLNWQRVDNALFISNPGHWDDDMLWTMHVSPNPYGAGWRMFYTGLSIRENGLIQRVGVAYSDDLYTWTKDQSKAYPLEISGEHYECTLDEGRHWVSFRDPFYYREGDTGYLLAAARVDHGPIIRRGCVALAKETDANKFEFCQPLYHPIRYDDIEVPTLFKLAGRYYLMGSIREDVKVHYWYADMLEGPYRNFDDNVLLPQGNYAARICYDTDSTKDDSTRILVWNFFYKGSTTQGDHMLPPPKELYANDAGELKLRSFTGFDGQVKDTLDVPNLSPLRTLFGNSYAHSKVSASACELGCKSGFEAFLAQGNYRDVRFSGELSLDGHGKLGLVARLDDDGNGYYISLDLVKGITQIRAWHARDGGMVEDAFVYKQLQASFYVANKGPHPFCLIAYGNYLELSLHGEMMLSLADDSFREGSFGVYVESADVHIRNLKLELLSSPVSDDYPSVTR